MRFLVLCSIWFALVSSAAAQSPAAAGQGGAGSEAAVVGAPDAVIAQARTDLRAVVSGLDTKTLDDSEIEARLAELPPIQAHLARVLAALNPRLQDLQAAQSQLGPPPPAGVPIEDARTVRTRRSLTDALAAVTAEVQEARLLLLRADQISATLADRLQQNFSARLWARTRSILDPSLWRDFTLALPADLARLSRATGEEATQAAPAGKVLQSIAIVAAALLLSLFLVGPGRVILGRIGYRRAARNGDVTRLRRILLALWLVLTAITTTLLAGLMLRAALIQIDAMTPAADRLTTLVIQMSVFVALVASLGRALLSPGKPEWRVAPLPEELVRRLAPFPVLIGATSALCSVVTGFNTILGVSQPTRVATDCLSVLVELAAVGGALTAVGRARAARRSTAPAAPSAAESESRAAWVMATLAAWVTLAAALGALVIGYLALASFLMREIVWIGAILAALSILLRLADDLFPTLLSPKSTTGLALETALGLSHGSMEQAGVLLAGVTRLLLFLLAWAAVLAHFGAGPEDIFRRFTASDFVVRLGLVSISPGVVFGGVALFLAGLALTRAVRRWLEIRYLPKTALDIGLRNSLASGVTYLGAIIALLVAFAYLGLTFAQIALFASALSVGIGFGLQSIIGNFVSGIVLLAERPVKVGDWIAIGDLEGDVRKISIRATEIEMADHSRLIVPNSDLVSKTVRNITHADAMGRVRIVLKLDGAADPDKVRQILLARLTGHAKILKEPPPAVYMTDVRDAALEFTAFAYLASPRQAYGVKSELLFQIVPDLRDAGIMLATTSTIVNVGLGDRLIEPEATPAAGGSS